MSAAPTPTAQLLLPPPPLTRQQTLALAVAIAAARVRARAKARAAEAAEAAAASTAAGGAAAATGGMRGRRQRHGGVEDEGMAEEEEEEALSGACAGLVPVWLCLEGRPPSSTPPPTSPTYQPNTGLPLHLLPSTAAGAAASTTGPSATATALSEGRGLRLVRLTKEEVGRSEGRYTRPVHPSINQPKQGGPLTRPLIPFQKKAHRPLARRLAPAVEALCLLPSLPPALREECVAHTRALLGSGQGMFI